MWRSPSSSTVFNLAVVGSRLAGGLVIDVVGPTWLPWPVLPLTVIALATAWQAKAMVSGADRGEPLGFAGAYWFELAAGFCSWRHPGSDAADNLPRLGEWMDEGTNPRSVDPHPYDR